MTTAQDSAIAAPGQKALDEAAEWLAEAADGDLEPGRRRAFSAWLRRSPENIAAYLEVAAFWSDVPLAAPAGGFDIAKLVEEAREEASVVALGAISAESFREQRPAIAASLTSRWRQAAAAAAVVGIAAMLWMAPHWRGTTYATDVGEQRSVTLADGSTVELNARTRLRVQLREHERSVTLEEGQALFTVAKDASRPFVVASGDIRVRAVGTQFDVDRRSARTTVTVLEGLVDVASDPEVPAVRLPAGRRLVVRAGEFAPPETVDVASATAWTDRQLVFHATPLGEVVEDFNRFSRRPLVVEDARLASLAISGVYASTDPASLIRFLRAQPGVRVDETESRVLITRD